MGLSGLVFGRSDWEYALYTSAFVGARGRIFCPGLGDQFPRHVAIGYHFIDRKAGSMNGNFLSTGMGSISDFVVIGSEHFPANMLMLLLGLFVVAIAAVGEMLHSLECAFVEFVHIAAYSSSFFVQ